MRVLGLVAIVLLAGAQADFGGSDGFSGRNGFTCVSCHEPGPVAATVALDGLPAQWEPGRAYELTVSVSGGPPRNPTLNTPDGGFDLEASAGTFDADARYVLLPKPNEATYTAQGSLLRQWTVWWTAPTEGEQVTFWLAGLAANGNHVIGLEESDGESGDSTHAIVHTVPRAQQAPVTESPGGGAVATLVGLAAVALVVLRRT